MKYLKKLYQIYEYAFYRTYDWQKKLWGESDAPEIAGLLTPFSFFFMNILGPFYLMIYIIIEVHHGRNSADIFSTYFNGIIVLFCVAFYYLFAANGKYFKIEQKYKRENREQRKKGLRFLWLYFFLSLLEISICCLIGWSIISFHDV